jgi:hypothetical protein
VSSVMKLILRMKTSFRNEKALIFFSKSAFTAV